jgi:AraC-like DNA-binding protein
MRVWSTEAVPQRESFAFWNDAVCDAFLRVRTERAERAQFQGSIASAQVGPLLLNRVRSERHLVRRSRNALARDTDDWFFVNLHQAGHSILSQGGREQHVDAGDLCFFDSTRPFDLDFPTDMALTCFLLPRGELIARAVDAPDAVVRAIPRHGVGALFHSFAAGLAQTASTLAPAEAAQAGVMFVDLLALALGATASTREAARPSVRQAIFAAIRADIRTHLGDPDLSLPTVAARAHIAPRTLQTLFQEQATSFTGYVLEQRLLLAERQLSRSASDISITEIAYAVGFSDLSYFSRCFHRRFGQSPRDFRAAFAAKPTGR